MVRDAEARGGGPLRRGNALPPETPDERTQTPPATDAEPTGPHPRPAAQATPAPGTRAAAAWAAASAATPPSDAAGPATPAVRISAPPSVPAASTAAAAAPPVAPAMPTTPGSSGASSTPAGLTAAWAEQQSSPPPDSSVRPAVPVNTAPHPQPSDVPPAPPLPVPTSAVPASNAAAAESASSASSRRQQREQGVGRRSFLQEERREEPARQGGRGLLNRVGFTLGPSARERAVRDDEHAVSRHWPGPRTVAVVNGKGGAGKTPATVLLSAVFAQYGGAGVLAWDNNQTRGTLGWRTETGAHDRTLLELLPQTQRLLGAQGQSADLAHFVHHQPQEKYDVLRSKPVRLAHENRLRPSDVDSIHAIAAKFYRLIIIDSGNDESDPMWLRMIDLADQIVVATTTRDDHAEAGALLLEALEDRDERSARLARESVVVVSQADPKATPAEVADVIAGYQPLAREVVGIPFDREMVDGHLRLRALASPTQRSWLSAAAAVARGF